MPVDVKRLARDILFGEHLAGMNFTIDNQPYMLAGKIGDGAIGVVRKATNLATGKTVAVKFLAPETRYFAEDSIDDIYRRFKREGERGAGLDHENLVKVIAYEENEGGGNFLDDLSEKPTHPFVVMEYVQGRTLEDYIRKEKPDTPRREFSITKETLHIALEITNSLVYLHKHGIVHRDVKPANIFLSKATPGTLPRTIKLGDFGVVKWGDFRATISTGTLTVVGQRGLGTLKYMAPEQSLDPQNVDYKSDVYALGITLFELFTNYLFPDIHHVIQLKEVRTEKGNVYSRLHTLKIPLSVEVNNYELLIDALFDCFLKPSGRPTSSKLQSLLRMYLRKFDE